MISPDQLRRLCDVVAYEFEIGERTAYNWINRIDNELIQQQDKSTQRRFTELVKAFIARNWERMADMLALVVPKLIHTPLKDEHERSLIYALIYFLIALCIPR